MQSRYLPNLNGLRAISVFVVMLQHATMVQREFGGYINHEWLWISGRFGVIIFFCISGLLISYLLDDERAKTGNIDTEQFYVRRILRIWPLYFLVAIPALLLNAMVTGSAHQAMNWKDYLAIFLILPGFADRPLFMGQTWSIEVEETFYAIYPLMFRYLSRKLLVLALSLVVIAPDIITFFGSRWCGDCAGFVRFYWSPIFYSTIAIGCLTYLIYSLKYARLNAFLFSPAVQCAALAAVVMVITAAITTGEERYFDLRWDALAFSIVILNAAFNPNSILQIENRLTKFLGEISYGMYMLHVYCICLVLMICWIFFKGDTFPFQNFIVSVLTVAFTIVAAKLSYDYIETPIRALARRPRTPERSPSSERAQGAVL